MKTNPHLQYSTVPRCPVQYSTVFHYSTVLYSCINNSTVLYRIALELWSLDCLDGQKELRPPSSVVNTSNYPERCPNRSRSYITLAGGVTRHPPCRHPFDLGACGTATQLRHRDDRPLSVMLMGSGSRGRLTLRRKRTCLRARPR